MAHQFENKFNIWLFSKWKRLRWSTSVPLAWSISFLSRLGITITAIAGLLVIEKEVVERYAKVLPPLANLGFIVVLLWTRIFRKPKEVEGHGKSSEAFRKFYKNWRGVWISWGCFYVMILFEATIEIISKGEPPPKIEMLLMSSRDALNNLNSAFIFLCYFVLAEPLASEVVVKKDGKFQMFEEMPPGGQLFLFVIFVICAELFIGSIWTATYIEEVHKWFAVFGGVLGGLAVALLVGRLQSKFTGAPVPLIACFFFYSLIQMTYPAFRMTTLPWIEAIVLSFAMPLKLLLFVFVH